MANYRLLALLMVAGLVAGWLPLYAPTPQALAVTPQIVINELAWAGSTLSTVDEWVELFNPSLSEVAVGGWQITKNTGTESLMITLPPATIIPAGGFFVISHFNEPSSVLAVEPNIVSASLTLSNSSLRISLYSGDWQLPTNLVDVAGDGGAPPAGNNTAKISMERDDDFGGWHDAQSATNLDVGVPDIATPASTNSIIVAPPTVSSMSPASGVAGESLNIESIVGTNLGPVPLTVKLVQGDRQLVATSLHVASPELIDGGVFEIPEDGDGSWGLTITTATGLVASLPSAVQISLPPPQYDLSTAIRINEVYPQPGTSSNDEFIELVNLGNKSIPLVGWVLDDIDNAGSSPFELDGLLLPPSGFLTLYKSQTKITLNDGGDTVRLIQPSGMVLDSTNYTGAIRGESWARTTSNWQWTTTPTPNGINLFTQAEPPPFESPAMDEPDDEPIKFEVGAVNIDELLPRPLDGDEEFIELTNTTSEPIQLDGWSIADASQHKYKFPNNTRLAGGARLVIYFSVSKIALNNSGGERVVLVDPTGNIISQLAYPDSAPSDSSFVRISSTEGTWIQPPTPGLANPTDPTEIESEVGGWVASDVADALPITGWAGTFGLALVTVAGLAIIRQPRLRQRLRRANLIYLNGGSTKNK